MNLTTLGWSLAVSITIAWFTARPVTWIQRIGLWSLLAIASTIAAILTDDDDTYQNVVIFTMPILAYLVYGFITKRQLIVIGEGFANATTIQRWWRQDAETSHERKNGSDSRTQVSPRHPEESIDESS